MMEWDQVPENTPLESVTVFGVAVKAGDRVRLWPQKSADIMDLALKGKVAVVEAIERDFDDQVHLAVVIEDDPGRDFGDGVPGGRLRDRGQGARRPPD